MATPKTGRDGATKGKTSVKPAKSAKAAESAKPAKSQAAKPETPEAAKRSPAPRSKPAETKKRAKKASPLRGTVASLYETAVEIVSERLEPTLEQVKALALAVIGQEDKKARKATRKANKPGKRAKSPKPRADSTTSDGDRKKKKK